MIDNNIPTFPFLEELLDQKKPNLDQVRDVEVKIKNMAENAKNSKDKQSAKLALKAFEQFYKLFDHLTEIKKDLESKSKK